MDTLKLTERQRDIIKRLEESIGDINTVEKCLSTPNKLFRSRPPIDLLLSENFDYFDRFFTRASN